MKNLQTWNNNKGALHDLNVGKYFVTTQSSDMKLLTKYTKLKSSTFVYQMTLPIRWKGKWHIDRFLQHTWMTKALYPDPEYIKYTYKSMLQHELYKLCANSQGL